METETIEQLSTCCGDEIATGARQGQCCYKLLARAAEKRDSAILDHVYTHYHRLLRYWLSKQCAANDDETMSVLWLRLLGSRLFQPGFRESFPQIDNALGYMRTVVVSLCIDRQRRTVRDGALITDADLPEGFMAGTLTAPEAPMSSVERNEFWASIERCLAGNERYLEVINLSYRQGYTPEEVAVRHPEWGDISSVYSLKASAMRKLRKCTDLHEFF